MNRTIWVFVLGLFLLLASSLIPVHAQTSVDATMTGSWFDPSHNGEGFLVEVLENDTAIVYWFTYDQSGDQRWFIGLGQVSGNTLQFDTLQSAAGPVFGEQFDPDEVVFSNAGNLAISWQACSNASATYTIDGITGSQSLVRLNTLAGLECDTPSSTPSTMTGSWFDQTHDGEGLVIEVLNDGRALVFWFSYDELGQQAWFFGVGDQDGTSISIAEMNITRGGQFGPDFDPEQVEIDSWGSLMVELGCDFGKLDYASELSRFGHGKQTLSRLTSPGSPDCEDEPAPNILLVIADDLGLDASNQYDISVESPATPHLDELAAAGLVFENAWSNPTCSPTRAGILTGKYGTQTGVLQPGDVLSEDETSLQSYIRNHLPGKYADAVIGKWHLAPQRNGEDHPSQLGISHFAGILGGGVADYENWQLTSDGAVSNETDYVTSKLVDLAIEWTSEQQTPWFLWLAFNAPHTPFHLPPETLHGRGLSGTESDIANSPLAYYLAAIEAMDTEIGRLLNAMDSQTRENTIVIFVGDNGTPARVAQAPYSPDKAKGSLYQGGINVPLFISGPGIERVGERESALINTTDLFSTIASLAGVNVSQINDSTAFTELLSGTADDERFIQFSERSPDNGREWAISDGVYKLIGFSDDSLELYQIALDPFETEDMVGMGTAPAEVIEDLQYLVEQIRQQP